MDGLSAPAEAPAPAPAAGKSFASKSFASKSSFASRSGMSFASKSSFASRSGKSDETGWRDFEDYGSFAGPPTRPNVSDVGATSLLLAWDAPQHLGGSGFEVLGYRVLVQYGGAGGFSIHTEDTGSDHPEHAVEQLSPDTWHEFEVAAITSAGVGAASPPSRPVLTERAPTLLRELKAATARLAAYRERLKRKRDELLVLARSGTMALRQKQQQLEGTLASAYQSTSNHSDGQAANAPGAAGGCESSQDASSFTAAEAQRHVATLSAAEAKTSVRQRKQLDRQVEALDRRVVEWEQRVAMLTEQQARSDEERRDELLEAAERRWETGEDGLEDGGADGGADGGGGRRRGQPGPPRDGSPQPSAPLKTAAQRWKGAAAAVGAAAAFSAVARRAAEGPGGGPGGRSFKRRDELRRMQALQVREGLREGPAWGPPGGGNGQMVPGLGERVGVRG